ncbi:Ig-like domain-containing protein [Fulvivirga sedimenti]|uniref:SbsA Ig-like domain-containing protein n=1 Tax=Fulvivirga sedimenti TaxID=2879465 RepID=A0A9X1L011_9BACT|nr:Ig-like domain-containing protein [Fulvivirga sedimenti]MCA6078935.1 hypothetical protein [Fulvivirga sedimenti]
MSHSKISNWGSHLLLLAGVVAFFLTGCGSSDPDPQRNISLLSASINGGNLVSGMINIPIEMEVDLVFSNGLNQNAFESQLSLSGGGQPSYDVVLSNGGTKATITADLNYDSEYTLTIGTGVIGTGGERLANSLNYQFTTAADDVIRSMAPCISDCLQSVELNGSEGPGTFEFYGNYPLYEQNAVWENLTQAVIVVHGASHNADDYYSYLSNSLRSESLDESTVLISPYFRNTSTGSDEDFYWSGVNYRDGDESSNSNKISSFKVLDELISQLADKDHFPVLQKIIITGQSSGGRFIHLYAPSNVSENNHPDISFEYIVSESQYFYYPDGRRIDEISNQLYMPSSCVGYDIWPFGYNVVPPYLAATDQATFNDQFTNRSIHYLLGSGTGSDPSFNTADCGATLLGSSRYQRGENMFRYMELAYPETHNHKKTVVPGVAHNGSQIYQSTEFKNLLRQLL